MKIPRKLSVEEMGKVMSPPNNDHLVKALAAVGYAQLEAGEVFVVRSKSEFVALVRGTS